MKAVLLTKHGGPEVLSYGEAPDPSAGPGEVVVDIHAASVNAADYKVRLGGNIKFPHILGRDFSGVVSASGAGVTDLAVGRLLEGLHLRRVCFAGHVHAGARSGARRNLPGKDANVVERILCTE